MPHEKGKKDYNKPANTFIDKGVTVQAQRLTGSESVRIDGTFIGDIELDAYLQIGETGQIEGNLNVTYAIIAGEITGNIICRATLHLSAKARVYGNIAATHIIIDEGAVFYGFCETKEIVDAEVVMA